MTTELDVLSTMTQYGWAAVIGLIGIIYKANNKKIDDIGEIASSALTREEFDDYSKRALCSRKEMKEQVEKLIDGQTRIFEAIARIEGKLEK